ncbi:MAG: hypothetical protein ACYDCO_27435 [Armatimonadota bacterium]
MVDHEADVAPPVPRGLDPLGRWLEWGFRRFAEKWSVWVLQGLAATGLLLLWLAVIAGAILGFLGGIGLLANPDAEFPGRLIAPFVLMIIVLALLGLPLLSFLMAGMINTALKQARGEEITVGDLFSAGWATLPVLGAGLLVGIMVAFGLSFFILPGLILATFAWLTVPLIVSRRLGVIDALQLSFTIVARNFWLFLLYTVVVSLLVNLLDVFGLILAGPLMALLQVAVIADLYQIGRAEPSVGEEPPGLAA